jgi:predicted transcriptional regulator
VSRTIIWNRAAPAWVRAPAASAIADAIDRPRSWVDNRALEAFVASETWQIEEIKRGLAEADAGEFATDAEAEATFENWQHLKCDAD